MDRLHKLNKIWKSLNEEADSDVPRETKDQPEKKEDVSVTAVSVTVSETKPSSKGTNPPTEVSKKFSIQDDNSKEVKPIDREMGAKNAVKDFVVSSAKMDHENPVPREMGAQEAHQDYPVTNAKMDHENPVPREMGAKSAPKEFLESYKSEISSKLNAIKEAFKF